MQQRLLIIILLFAFFSIERPCLAQTVIMEDQGLAEQLDGWQAGTDLDFYTSKSKTAFYNIGFGTQILYRKQQCIYKLLNETDFLFSDDDDFEKKSYTHLRFSYVLNPVVKWEWFTQGQFDEILKIKLRGLIGTGPEFDILLRESYKIQIGALYMFEYEEEDGTGLINRHHRASLNLFGSLKLSQSATGTIVNYYQPRLDQFSDYRVSSGASLALHVSNAVLIKITGAFTYDQKPVIGGTEKLTYKIKTGIGFKL